ncbi:FAD-dependent monooxygenase [Massilia sp. IC2-477]|uniref:FAD-dependent oxidoreductase n=1 Tax=Massilia sp. IC2-477 TaxID=2887198 RepID=UPI001D112DA6|nr:NAD(P)/FAD-dependent oxidoreductase [Massilia sp. IC2-477]MCC2957841.1 FAD-dependent monooxygenase [Massilia sp. IC2-477]
MDSVSDSVVKTGVLVVGAGPVGMALHLALRRQGVACIQVDKHAAGLNTSRAAVIHARTLEVLESLGVVPELLSSGLQVTDFRVRETDRVLLHIGFSELPSVYRYALMCPQDQTERILRRHLDAAGGLIDRPETLLTLAESADGVLARVGSPDRGSRTVHAQWVVGCDGVHSTVRELAGIAFEGEDYTETFVLADVRMDWPIARCEVSLFFSARGLVVVAPLPEEDGRSTDRYRIVATVAQSGDAPGIPEVQAILDERGPRGAAGRIRELLWSSAFYLQHRVAEQVSRGRVLLCGDAAHAHSPAGGQGMNTGIQDALSLAAPLAQALREGDLRALEAWAARRHAVAREVVRMTDAMTRAATVASPLGRSLRNTMLDLLGRFPLVQEKIATRLAQLHVN